MMSTTDREEGPQAPAPAPAPSQHSTPLSVPQKRRVGLACTNCRRRKSRCNGSRPTCSTCVILDLKCDYQEVSQNQANQKRRSIARTDDGPQIHPTAGHRNAGARLERTPTLIDSRRTRAVALDPDDVLAPEPNAPSSGHISSTLPAQTSAVQSDDEGAVDAQATATFNDEPDVNTGYFGPSSNHALFRSLSNAFAQFISHIVPLCGNFPSTSTGMLRQSPARRSKTSVFGQEQSYVNTMLALPSEQEMSILVDQFFTTVDSVLPIVSKAAVLSECHRLCRPGSSPQNPSSRALLNIIFAHASRLSKAQEAETFYHRALVLLDQRTLRGATVELLQALLLVTIFQQNNQRSIASWTFHALAVKSAYQLGMQSESTYKEYGLQESQLRKRLWYAVILQDRLLSLFLGRPCLIPPSHIRTVKPASQSGYHDIPTITTERRDALVYYDCIIDLWDILGDALHQLYEDNIDPECSLSAQESVTQRLQFQWKLDDWRQATTSLHGLISEPELDHIQSSSYNSIHFRIMLSLQYCYAVILIDRPILCKLLGARVHSLNAEQALESLLTYAVIVIKNDFQAIKDLHHIINAVCTCAEPFVDRNGAWLLCNYTMLTLNMHLFVILLICQKYPAALAAAAIHTSEVRTLLGRGLDTMKAVSRNSLMSLKARTCLIRFVQIFDEILAPTSWQSDANISRIAGNLSDSAVNVPAATPAVSPSLAYPTGDLSHYVTQAANEFLWEFSQNDLMDTDFTLSTFSQMNDIWTT